MKGIRLLGLLPIALGCGSTGATFEYDDKVAVKNAFIDVVRERYGGRPDGRLQAPDVQANRVRCAFLYNNEVDGADSEYIDLTFGRQVDANKARAIYRVLVYQPLQGPNRVLREQGQEIAALLQQRLESPPK